MIEDEVPETVQGDPEISLEGRLNGSLCRFGGPSHRLPNPFPHDPGGNPLV